MRTHKFVSVKRSLAFGLSLAMLLPPATGLLGTASAQDAMSMTPRSILIFPFANNAGTAGDSVAARVDDAIKLRINTVGVFKATSFSKFLPSVQRAGPDGDALLTTDQLTAPFDGTKGQAIAAQVGMDSYLVGSINTVTVDETSKKVTLEISATLHDTQTGASTRNLANSGSASPTSNSDTIATVTQAAVNDAAGKLVAALNASAPKMQARAAAPIQKGKSRAAQSVLFGILGTALLIAILSNSGGGGGGGSSTSSPVSTSGGGGGSTSPPSPPNL